MARQRRNARGKLLGPVVTSPADAGLMLRDTQAAAWWLRPLARYLARREARILEHLAGDPAFPAFVSWDGRRLQRSAIPGAALQDAPATDIAWFRSARRALGRMHRRGVAHNDLAREPNWLVRTDGGAAIIDFELAWLDRRRGRLFRLMAREDLRHLLKHKRYYLPGRLTARERALLERPSAASRLWRVTMRPLARWLRRAATVIAAP